MLISIQLNNYLCSPLKKCNNKMNIIQSYFVYDAVIYRMLYDKN